MDEVGQQPLADHGLIFHQSAEGDGEIIVSLSAELKTQAPALLSTNTARCQTSIWTRRNQRFLQVLEQLLRTPARLPSQNE